MCDTVTVTIPLSSQLYAQLEAAAQARGLSVVELVQAVVGARLQHNAPAARAQEPGHGTKESAVLYDVMHVSDTHLSLEKLQTERQRVYELLYNAGLIRENPPVECIQPVSDAELAVAAHALGAAGPLSELIIAERAGR